MSTTRLVSIFALVLITVASNSAMLAAQRTASLTPGARVRVRFKATTQPIVGILDTISRDTVRLGPEGEHAASRVAVSTIEGIDVSRGQHSNVGKGAVWGGAIVGGMGLITGVALASDQGSLVSITGGEAVELTVASTALGAGVGALIGSLVRSEKWEAVPLSTLQVAPVSLNRVAITLSLSF